MNARREPGHVFRMASFRLAVLGTLFTTIGAIMVFALIYAATFRAAHAEFGPIVASERALLLAHAPRSESALAALIATTIRQAPHSYYALADAQGNLIGGNITMPASPFAWQELTRLDDDLLPPGVLGVDGIATRLPGGETLFIGEDASPFVALNLHIAYLFAGIFGFTLLLGLLAATLIAFYSLKRVTAISQASREIMAGDLSRRIKLYGVDDELDFLTADLNEMLAAMETLVVNARQVTNDIAHDLRSPLTRLHAQLERQRRAALAAALPGGKLADALGEALGRLDDILRIFASLLRIAEIEAGAVRGVAERIDVTALCRELADSYEPVAQDRGQVLTVDVADPLSMIGDAGLIGQMLVNVLENAIHHCPAHVPLRLRAYGDHGVLAIEIADRGAGIDPADRDRVFGRFVRLERARDTPGNGLGLALVRAIAQMHGGTVTLHDNRPGLIVRIMLPTAIAPASDQFGRPANVKIPNSSLSEEIRSRA